MERLFLTSAGFENPALAQLFLKEAGMAPENLRVLYIPTAAVSAEAKAVLPKCYSDLTGNGILPEHITVYDLDKELTHAELDSYQAIYVCGGSPEYLLERMNAVNFKGMLEYALGKGIIYIGVSAGSMVCSSNLTENLGYFSRKIYPHCQEGSSSADVVNLTDSQMIFISEGKAEIVS